MGLLGGGEGKSPWVRGMKEGPWRGEGIQAQGPSGWGRGEMVPEPST